MPAKTTSSISTKISGKTFQLASNDRHLKRLSFGFQDNTCDVKIATDTAAYNISFGTGTWQKSETVKHGPSLVAAAKASFVGLPPLKVAASYSWKDDHTLILTLRYIESPHTEKMTCHFDENNLSLEIENSFEYGVKKPALIGKIID